MAKVKIYKLDGSVVGELTLATEILTLSAIKV